MQPARTLRFATLVGTLTIGSLSCGARTGLGVVQDRDRDAAPSDASTCDSGVLAPLAASNPGFLFLTDASGSMVGAQWEAATTALASFFAAPRSTGLSVALTFFPVTPGYCDAATYAKPAVPLGTLAAQPAPTDIQESLLLEALSSKVPDLGTPLLRAFEGSIGYMQGQPATPSGLEIVVITDGHPSNDCTTDEMNAAIALAGSAYTGSSKLVTHVIGIGDDIPFGGLSDLASAGGGKAVFVDANTQLQTLLVDALVETTRTCTFLVPDASTLDLALLGAGAAPTPLVEVAGSEDCGDQLAWFRQSAGRVILCPKACEQADSGVQVVNLCAAAP